MAAGQEDEPAMTTTKTNAFPARSGGKTESRKRADSRRHPFDHTNRVRWPKQFTDHTASTLLGIPPGFAVCHLANDAGQHGWNTYENDKGLLNVTSTTGLIMNIMHTTDSSPAVPAWIGLTPPANRGPGPTAASKSKASVEAQGMVSMWKTMENIQFEEDCIFALLWICSLAALIACFVWLP